MSTTSLSSAFAVPADPARPKKPATAANQAAVHARPMLRSVGAALILSGALGVDALIGELPVWAAVKVLLALPVSFAALVATLLVTGAAELMRR